MTTTCTVSGSYGDLPSYMFSVALLSCVSAGFLTFHRHSYVKAIHSLYLKGLLNMIFRVTFYVKFEAANTVFLKFTWFKFIMALYHVISNG